MPTEEQWLQLHKVCLDTIRGAIAGLPDEEMAAKPLPSGKSIGGELNHVIGAEIYWLREVNIEPAFQELGKDAWTESDFVGELEKTQRQYQDILREQGLEANILFGLGRVCLHALYHFVKAKALRKALQPEWEPPGWPGVGSWERAVDFVSNLLICGEDARPVES